MRIPTRVSKTLMAALGLLAFAACIGIHARSRAAHLRQAAGTPPSAATWNALRTLSRPGSPAIGRRLSNDRHRTRMDFVSPTEPVLIGHLRFVESLPDATPRANCHSEKHPFRNRPPPAA
jgi:hypothetical protein